VGGEVWMYSCWWVVGEGGGGGGGGNFNGIN